MKIISKDTEEMQQAVKTPPPRKRKTGDGDTSGRSVVKPSTSSKTEQRKAHLEKEKRRREQIKNKKVAPVTSEKKIENSEPTYFETMIEKFVSLLRFNITFKLTLGYTLRLIFLIVFLFVVVYGSFSFYLYFTAQNEMDSSYALVNSTLTETGTYENEGLERYLNSEALEFYVYNQNKDLVFYNSDTPLTYEESIQFYEYDFRDFPRFPDLIRFGTYIDIQTEPVYFSIQKKMEPLQNIIESTFPIGFVLCFVLIISSIASASKMANKHLKPIHTMTEQVKDMSANNLSTRLNVSGTKDELKDLSHTFNKMLDDIQKSYEREKQFVSDASHELRTPIAVIKGYAGMLNRWGKDDPEILNESIQAILGETDNMHSLVESLLFIARNDKGTLKMDMDHFNLSELICEIVKETKMIDTQHKIIEAIEENVPFYGSMDKLKQALRIFVDNSIKYTPDDGEISIVLRTSEKHNIIIISDNGIGISKEDLPHIFDRFYRADKSRTKMKENQHGGTGLGLSIAKIIIEQHRGRIQVDSALNEGTKFTLLIPKPEEAPQI
ncbi:MAG: HAMP domain-containing histidine kinase [Clostridia bacterium]|nr:HAMP domain-containing histidine kinase [Clostridia bacterium]